MFLQPIPVITAHDTVHVAKKLYYFINVLFLLDGTTQRVARNMVFQCTTGSYGVTWTLLVSVAV